MSPDADSVAVRGRIELPAPHSIVKEQKRGRGYHSTEAYSSDL